MKRNLLLASVVFAAGSLMAADPKDDVASAIKKLAAADSYGWKQTTENANQGGGGGFGGGPVEGKAEKGGWVYTSSSFNDTTIERVMKGTNGASSRGDGWQTDAERIAARAGGGGGGGGGGRRGGGFGGFGITAPTTTAETVLGQMKEVKESGGAYVGDLTEEGAKGQALPNFGGRRGGGGGGGAGFTPPEVTGAKGSAKFWLKDGVLSKYEVKVQGKMSFNDNEIEINRTTTVEIKDVGTAKINVPEDVKKKLQ
jgi:hypothetical protein